MSYNGLDDKDLPLKLRMMSLLWNLGWFVRPNVKLYRYEEGKRTNEQFTDIDVLAIKILPFQIPITAICSVKSGRESDSSQIFWLAGIKSYFGASFAYYLRSKASLTRAKSLCEKLDIITLNEEQLEIIEKRFSSEFGKLDIFSLDVYKKIHSYFAELKEKKKSLYDYITERFWIDPANNQLLRIITAMRDIRNIHLNNDCKIYMKYYLSSLLALPLHSIVDLLIKVPANSIRTELDTALMGGEIARMEKERILGACKIFLSELVKRAKLPEDVAKNGDIFLERMFELDYADNLSDLLINTVECYSQSIYTPRMIDGLLYQFIRNHGSVPKINSVTVPNLSKEDWKYSAKLTRDLLIFVYRIGCFEKSEIDI